MNRTRWAPPIAAPLIAAPLIAWAAVACSPTSESASEGSSKPAAEIEFAEFPSKGPFVEPEPVREPEIRKLADDLAAWEATYKKAGHPVMPKFGDLEELIDGKVNIALSNRRIGTQEWERALVRGFQPVEHAVGWDVMVIYVHHDNPIEWLSESEVAEIFGEGGGLEVWSDLMEYSIPGCQSDEIVRYGLTKDSETYRDFQETVLGFKRGYRDDVTEIFDPRELVEIIKRAPCAVGYSRFFYHVEHVKVACIAKGRGVTAKGNPAFCAFPSPEAATSGKYPIVRPLLMYSRGQPRGAVKTFLSWIRTRSGRCAIKKQGYAPFKAVKC